MSHERDDAEQAMEDEMRELLRDAKKRPITPDEEAVILWHMGYAVVPRRDPFSEKRT